MAEQAGLEQRVAELEAQVARLSQGRLSGVRRRSLRGIGKLPFFELAVGPDPEKGERRGHAKAVLAIGDIATGVVAIGALPAALSQSAAWRLGSSVSGASHWVSPWP